MTVATASVTALLLCHVAAACLAHAMARHDLNRRGAGERRTVRVVLGIGGGAALAAALATCMFAWGPWVGVVGWFGMVGAGCLAWIGLSAFLPRTALWLAPVGTVLLVVSQMLPS